MAFGPAVAVKGEQGAYQFTELIIVPALTLPPFMAVAVELNGIGLPLHIV